MTFPEPIEAILAGMFPEQRQQLADALATPPWVRSDEQVMCMARHLDIESKMASLRADHLWFRWRNEERDRMFRAGKGMSNIERSIVAWVAPSPWESPELGEGPWINRSVAA